MDVTTIPWALSVPGIIFLVVVVPLWILCHYATAWMRMRASAAGPGKVVIERAELDRMRALADGLEQRIESLETILDAEAPGWRRR